jgi:hypothetical protein
MSILGLLAVIACIGRRPAAGYALWGEHSTVS